MNSLRRYRIPELFAQMIGNIYAAPQFCVKLPFGFSDSFTQRCGIKQGCCLSPFLFILVTSIMFTEILQDYNTLDGPFPSLLPLGAMYPCLLYADDTLLLRKNLLELHLLLRLVVEHSLLYGLLLNEAKCKLFVISRLPIGELLFPSEKIVLKVRELIYLGALFTSDSHTTT
eukprot:6484291-Amphidinium_carterae.1